ncbi:MAG: trypsin-like peptidase domain-containing protein [Myxococcales bacterium]|nr:trypsin-like peptidase domain-containing protein [Myxococcales bacterium]
MDHPRPDSRTSSLWLAAGTGLVGVSLGAAAVLLGLGQRAPRVEPAPVTLPPQVEAPAVVEPAVVTPPVAAPPSLVDAVTKTRDAVVNLGTQRTLGAGVIVDPQGLVVTNYHVIADALEVPRRLGPDTPSTPSVTARFEDGRELPATILVADSVEDLAILRLTPPGPEERFAAVALGQSAALAVGQEVFAIGNPFGLNHSVSRGIVSALDRTEVLQRRKLPLIQLDASVNLGNSGGPLFALDGSLVGIVTLRKRDAEGIAFAVPVDHVRGFLRAVGDVETPRRSGAIGVEIQAERPGPEGAILGYGAWLDVVEVLPDGAAERAGLREGDRVVEIRGKRLDGLPQTGSVDDLTLHLVSTVRSMFPGERLALTIVRDGAIEALEVEVGAAPSDRQVVIDAEDLLGLRLRHGSGVPVIEAALPGTPFDELRDLRGVEVVRLVDRTIASMEDLGAELTKLRDLVRSGHGPIRVRVGLHDPTTGSAGAFLVLVE